MDTRTPIDDATAALSRLSADDIRRRLDELDAESRSLRVLLRSLRARETAARRREGAK